MGCALFEVSFSWDGCENDIVEGSENVFPVC